MRVDGEFVQGGVGQVYLDDEVGRRLACIEVYAFLASYPFGIAGEVEALVRLETALQILSLERRGAGIGDVYRRLYRELTDQDGDDGANRLCSKDGLMISNSPRS